MLGYKHSEETLLKLNNKKVRSFTEEEKLKFVESPLFFSFKQKRDLIGMAEIRKKNERNYL